MFLRIQTKVVSAAFWSCLCPCVEGTAGAAVPAFVVPLRSLRRHSRSYRASGYLLIAFSPSWSGLQPNLDDADADEGGDGDGDTGSAAVDGDVEGEGEGDDDRYLGPCAAQNKAVDHHHSIPSILAYKEVVQGDDDDDAGGGVGGAAPVMGDDVVGTGPKFPSCLSRDRIPGPCVADKPIEYS